MSGGEDRDLLAAEYVLGTLEIDEARRAEDLVQQDEAFRAAVETWERRLAPLATLVPANTPPPELWSRIEASTRPAAAVREPLQPRVSRPEARGLVSPAQARVLAGDDGGIVRPRSRSRRLRVPARAGQPTRCRACTARRRSGVRRRGGGRRASPASQWNGAGRDGEGLGIVGAARRGDAAGVARRAARRGPDRHRHPSAWDAAPGQP